MRLLVVVLTVVVGVVSAGTVLAIRHVGSAGGPASAQATVVRPAAAQAAAPAAPAATTARPEAAQSAAAQPAAAAASCTGKKVGVATDNLGQFQAATKIYPSVAVRYVTWGSAFPSSTVLGYHGVGVVTQLVLEPHKVRLSAIAGGRDDGFLARWAAADKRLHYPPIILSFAPEGNGSWYTWGKGHVTAALFKKAFRRVHNVLVRDGARKITWMWQVNVIFPTSESLGALYPGAAYVSQVGIDGQVHPGQTFNSVFGSTIRQLRTITNRPLAIGEIAVTRGKGRVARINELFTGVCHFRLARFVWFDIKRKTANFELEGDPSALKAFRKGVAKLGPA
jgi:Glycosyl hydrolase family 26